MGEAAALGAAMCWAMCSLAFASAGRSLGSLGVNLTKLVLGGAMLLVAGAVWSGPFAALEVSARDWAWLSVSGFVGFFLGDMFLIRSLLMLGPRLTTLVMSTWPITAALMAWATFGDSEALAGWQWVGMAVTLGGVWWVLAERPAGGARHKHYVRGALFGLLGAAGQAAGYILAKNSLGPGGCDALIATQIRILTAIPAYVVLITIRRAWPQMRPIITQRRVLGAMAFGSFVGPVIGVVLSLVALQYIQAGMAATYMATAPILVLPLVWLLHKERISPRAALGAAVAAAGLGLLKLSPDWDPRVLVEVVFGRW